MSQAVDFERVAERGPQRFSATFEFLPEEIDRLEVSTISPVRIEGIAAAGDRDEEFVVRGSVRFEADLYCARCLEPFPFAIHSDFTLRYVPRPAGGESVDLEEVEIGAEELDREYYDEPRVDLRPIAAEQVQLNLPMKPLCEEACLGLCPTCGANRNRGGCACPDEESDPRWDALRGIRDQLARKKDQ